MQITNIGSGDGGKNSDAVYHFIFWGSFYLIFLNKRTFIASCRDLSPNRPFQELSVYYSIHQTFEILRSSILGWNLGVQNVFTYYRTPDYICYNFFLIFFRIQKTKEEQSALLKRSFCQKKRFVLICEVFSVMAKMLSVTSQNLDWNVESLAKRKLYLKV